MSLSGTGLQNVCRENCFVTIFVLVLIHPSLSQHVDHNVKHCLTLLYTVLAMSFKHSMVLTSTVAGLRSYLD